MSGVQRYKKIASLEEALEAKKADPEAVWLAGGTLLLAGDYRDKSVSVIDLGAALSKDIARTSDELSIGALATFQKLADSAAVPACLAEAALTMANRNTRNRATVGGNIGADKSCSSLIPILLALGAELELVSVAGPQPVRTSLEAFLEGDARRSRSELVTRIILPLRSGTRAAYRRWNRSACDLSVIGAAAAFELRGGRVKNLRLALGGLGPRSRRSAEIEALFEGKELPGREDIEAAVRPLLRPVDDLRASAAFKALRGAQLVADALLGAEGDAAGDAEGDAAVSGDSMEARP
jgi:probable selenate reductase FAD-binding subunit